MWNTASRENTRHMDSEQASNGSGTPATSIVGSVLRNIRESALRLSLEARDYFGTHWPPDPRLTALDDRMVMNREMLFISARLSQVVLWALSQDPDEDSADAAADGESGLIPPAGDDTESAPPADVSAEPWTVDPLLLSSVDNTGEQIAYHPRFQALREASLALYERVSRLHEQATLEVTGGPAPRPQDR